MYNLLISGDTTYQLQDAQSLRASIAKSAESLDILSKKIAAIPADSSAPRAVALQNAVRRSTHNYIKEYLLNLPNLPTPGELQAMKEQRLLKKTEEFNISTPVTKLKKVAVTTGWSPASVSTEYTAENDPLLEQIQIVKNFIRQAVDANRFDEVVALRENLKLLQQTYDQEHRLRRTT